MTDENQTVEAGPLSTLPASKGINIAGQKGVSLGAEQSSAIRDRLMQMIAEREGYQGSWKHIGDLGALAAAPIGGYSAAYDQYAARNRQREKDLLELQMGVGQLDTEQARLKQQADDNKFYADMVARLSGQQKPQAGGLTSAGQQQQPQPQPPVDGVGPMQPQAGGLPAAQGQGAPGALPGGRPALTPEQAMVLSGPAYRSNPLERSKELARMINQNQKPTDLERELETAGVPLEMRRRIIAAKHLGTALDEKKVTNPKTGYPDATTQWRQVGELFFGDQPPPAATEKTQGAAPGAPTQQAAAPSAAAVNPTATPNIGATGVAGVQNPAPFATEDWRNFRAEQARKQLEVAATAEMEAQKPVAKAFGDERVALDAAVGAAGDDLLRAGRIKQNVERFPDVVNRLNESKLSSLLVNIADQGIQTPYGSINVPALKDVETILAGSMQGLSKEQQEARTTAAQQLARDFATLALRASNLAKGQGSVSDNERKLFEKVAGDYTRLTPQNVRYVAKAIELEAHNAKERKALWSEMKGKGMTWEQYKDSPKYQSMLEKQYYRSAKALGITDPPAFNPATNNRREEARQLFR